MNNKNVFLLYPPVSKFERYSSDIGNAGGAQIPLGIYYLAAYLRQHSFNVRVLDAEALNLNTQEVLKAIEDFSPAYVGVSSTTVAFHRACEVADELKIKFPDQIIILGGPHVTSNPEHALNNRSFDYGVIGEGEVTLLELLNTINLNGDIASLDGIAFLNNDGALVKTSPRTYIKDIDTIPFPAYDLIDDISLYTPPPSNYKTLPVINIITSRGCPSQCTFCDKNIFGNLYRRRSPENIAEEIKYLKSKYNVKEIAFVDDTFLINKKRIYALFDILEKENIRFDWTCMSRINDVDEEFLTFIKAHGCWHISFGIESGSPEILQLIKKNVNLPKARQIIKWCAKLGIKTKGFFMIGHPGETIQTLNQTIKLACNLHLDDIVATINTPIPGSPQYADASLYGHLDITDWSQYNYWRPVFVPFGLTQDILLKKHKEIYRKFYLRPQIILRYFTSFFSKGGWHRFTSVFKASLFLFRIKK